MSYQREREECIDTLARAGLPRTVIGQLLREATGINRRAELACSSEAADRDRVKCPATNTAKPCLCDGDHNGSDQAITRITVQDWRAEQRLERALPTGWAMLTAGDPRGYTLRVIPPSYAAQNAGRERHELDSIGIPPGPSRLRW